MNNINYQKVNSRVQGGSGISRKKFVITWFMAFCVMFTMSSVMGLFPESDDSSENFSVTPEARAETNGQERISPETPLRIEAPAIGLNTAILNPDSRDISVLDSELTKGAVRYPGSGLAGEKNSNMFVFGHSSRLPIVRNKAYQAFNDLEKLSKGDTVIVYGAESEFVYRVTSVRESKASDVRIEFKSDKSMLTLSTCNTFGDLGQDRFVVEAELVETRLR